MGPPAATEPGPDPRRSVLPWNSVHTSAPTDAPCGVWGPSVGSAGGSTWRRSAIIRLIGSATSRRMRFCLLTPCRASHQRKSLQARDHPLA
jgi:hypothetical protein